MQRDPLDDLGRLWRDLQPPSEVDDPRERAVVDWMRAAWNAAEPATGLDEVDSDSAATAWARAAFEAVTVPTTAELRAASGEPRRGLPRLTLVAPLVLALAAAVLALLRPDPTAPAAPDLAPIAAPVQIASVPEAVPAPTVHVHRDGLELRSGRVRLLLIQPDPAEIVTTDGELR